MVCCGSEPNCGCIACVNERLRSALAQREMTVEQLADGCSVDPKTVNRWIASGRVPHARHRYAAAKHLQVDETYLWPAGERNTPLLSGVKNEMVEAYPNRASVPRQLWIELLNTANARIDILVFSGTFLVQTNPHIARMLRARAEAGVRVRLCFGDPQGEAVAVRGREEGIGATLAAKIEASLTYYRELRDAPRCEVRLHDTTLYNSLFRYDDHLFVNPHVFGQPASANPLFRLRATDRGEWFPQYTASFDAVWSTARPWAPEDRKGPHDGTH
jgi:transcriptional regulator with XRE-family HTH domain